MQIPTAAVYALCGNQRDIATALGLAPRTVRAWGEYVPAERRESVYGLLTHQARQYSSAALQRTAQLYTALYGSTMRPAAQHPAAPQDPDWDANLDFLLGDLGCMPTVDTALHTALPATHATSTAPAAQHAALPSAQHAALPGTAPQKSAPTQCPVSTLTNSSNTGRTGPVKAGLVDYYLPDFKYEGVETQSFRRPWKSARSKGLSSVLQ